MTQQELSEVRESVRKYMGQKIRFSANQGRHRYETSEGIISETYPNIFVVRVISDNPYKNNKKMTFSYHDIVTKDLKMQLLTR
ncbi:MAG: Veg family protein [Lachnospiraceae bacterium]|nr:Veg family protein [Lachnospiraceae bacterium]